ncbi:hypothetical protein [Nostoc sp. FACHB-133]|nr:hypothetical protein [Nostoc sp. FACHB-133]
MPGRKNYITFGLTKDNSNFMSQAERHMTVLQITTGDSEIN